MKPELKEAWLKNLRSGNFAQTRGHLGESSPAGQDSFCCLGVLCETAGCARLSRNVKDDYGHAIFGYTVPPLPGGDNGSRLTEKLLKGDFGLNTNQIKTLIAANDSGMSFSEIADWIEENI